MGFPHTPFLTAVVSFPLLSLYILSTLLSHCLRLYPPRRAPRLCCPSKQGKSLRLLPGAMWASPPTKFHRKTVRRGRCLHRPALPRFMQPSVGAGFYPARPIADALLVTVRRGGRLCPPARTCTAFHIMCHCEPVTDVTGVAIRTPKPPLRKGKSPKRCQWQKKRGDFEEVPRLAGTTVPGNRLARRCYPGGSVGFPQKRRGYALRPQQFLYFFPLPQGHGSFRPIFCTRRGCFFTVPSPPTLSPVALATRSRLISSSFLMRTE